MINEEYEDQIGADKKIQDFNIFDDFEDDAMQFKSLMLMNEEENKDKRAMKGRPPGRKRQK